MISYFKTTYQQKGENLHMSEERFFLYDDLEETETRFISFMGQNERFDLGIMKTNRFYGKSLVFDLQGGRFAIIGTDDLQTPGYLENTFQLNEKNANELRGFLIEIINV